MPLCTKPRPLACSTATWGVCAHVLPAHIICNQPRPECGQTVNTLKCGDSRFVLNAGKPTTSHTSKIPAGPALGVGAAPGRLDLLSTLLNQILALQASKQTHVVTQAQTCGRMGLRRGPHLLAPHMYVKAGAGVLIPPQTNTPQCCQGKADSPVSSTSSTQGVGHAQRARHWLPWQKEGRGMCDGRVGMHCCSPARSGVLHSLLLEGSLCLGDCAHRTHTAPGRRLCCRLSVVAVCAGRHCSQQVGWSTQKGCVEETCEPQQTARSLAY